MLLGDFYHIRNTSAEGQNIRVEVSFNPAHRVFKGHFPGLPVVPGVCQLQMLTEVLSHYMNREIDLVKAAHVKFLKLLNPVEHPNLLLEISVTEKPDGKLGVKSLYSWGGDIFFRFKGEVQ